MSVKLSLHSGLRLTIAALVFMAGCATTVEDRIQADLERFEGFPPEIQQSIRAGEVEPGFSEAMVRMALGEPDRVYQRFTGEVTEDIWVYIKSRPRFTFGLGGMVGGRGSAVSTGVGIQPGGAIGQTTRVIIRSGKVYAVERKDAVR